MELTVSVEDLEPLPEPKELENYVKPEGLLNSNYQSIVRKNFNNTIPHSVFGIRQRLKKTQYKFTSSIEVLLKVSAFATFIIAFFS